MPRNYFKKYRPPPQKTFLIGIQNQSHGFGAVSSHGVMCQVLKRFYLFKKLYFGTNYSTCCCSYHVFLVTQAHPICCNPRLIRKLMSRLLLKIWMRRLWSHYAGLESIGVKFFQP